MKIFRNLYAWTLKLSKRKTAKYWLFFIAFIESSFFPIPPDTILIPMCLSKHKKSWLYASICLLGSILGGILGYTIGYLLWESIGTHIINMFSLQKHWNIIEQYYQTYGILCLFLAGFTPIPYKVFTIFSGVMAMNLPMFIVISSISRGLRFFLVAGILYVFNKQAKKILNKHLNKVIILITIVISILLLLLIKKS